MLKIIPSAHKEHQPRHATGYRGEITMKQIFKFCGKYLNEKRGKLILYILICIFSSMTTVVFPYISGSFIDQLVQATDTSFLGRYIAIFVSFSIVGLVLGYVSNRLYMKLQTQIAFRLNVDAIKHVQNLSPGFTQGQDTAYLNQRINNDSNALIIFCIGVLQQIVINAVMVIAPLALIFSFNAYLGIALIVLNALYFLSYTAFKKTLFKASYEYKEEQSKYFGKLNEQLFNVKFIQLHGVGSGFIKRLTGVFTSLLNNALRYQKTSYLFSSVDKIIMTVANVLVFLFGGISVINESLSVGYFAIISSYFSMMMSATRYFFTLGQSVQENTVSYNRLKDIFGVHEQSNGEEVPDGIDCIETRNLTFSYGNNCVLRDCSVMFKKGNIYALTGENGSGKSTLINVLVGLYMDEFWGEVLYNGIRISGLDMRRVRNGFIGISEQEPMLLPDTLRYNITLDEQGELDEEKFYKLCGCLGMEEFIDSLPNDLDTVINEKSSNLSGGEKQKISLLRVLMKNPDVLILDEPTSALDRSSRKRLGEYLQSIRKEKIIIISTHDKAFIEICDEEVSVTSLMHN